MREALLTSMSDRHLRNGKFLPQCIEHVRTLGSSAKTATRATPLGFSRHLRERRAYLRRSHRPGGRPDLLWPLAQLQCSLAPTARPEPSRRFDLPSRSRSRRVGDTYDSKIIQDGETRAEAAVGVVSAAREIGREPMLKR